MVLIGRHSIYHYDAEHRPSGKPFVETDPANFGGSFYSYAKSWVEEVLPISVRPLPTPSTSKPDTSHTPTDHAFLPTDWFPTTYTRATLLLKLLPIRASSTS